ncbi:hypothetical protein T492DRAFT_952109 [Pavlovales sp. CCMP2436]|nr:hypothetical protein T492DRAFT_952109 [Pavlovales sp. CCMP2436]
MSAARVSAVPVSAVRVDCRSLQQLFACKLCGDDDARRAERDDDNSDASFHSAMAADLVDTAHVAPHLPREEEWKAQFAGTWQLEAHRDDYDRWLSLKVSNGFKRTVAASLPATKLFVFDDPLRFNCVTHVYTLARTLELVQHWNMANPEDWREEVEAGLKCLISSSWGPRTLVIQKKFLSAGLLEHVENSISTDGLFLTATMRTTVVATDETRSTCDRFRRVG